MKQYWIIVFTCLLFQYSQNLKQPGPVISPITPGKDGKMEATPGTPGKDGKMEATPGIPGKDGKMEATPGTPGKDGKMEATPGKDGKMEGKGPGETGKKSAGKMIKQPKGVYIAWYINTVNASYKSEVLDTDIWEKLGEAKSTVDRDVYAYVAISEEYTRTIVVFRGLSWKNRKVILTDFRQFKESYSHCKDCLVHKKIYDKYKLVKKPIDDLLIQAIKDNPDHEVVITGHGVGGAMAILYANHVKRDFKEIMKDIPLFTYTFGSPRVGNDKFAEYTNKLQKISHITRVIYDRDPVQYVPKKSLGFAHCGLMYRYMNNKDYVNVGEHDVDETSPMQVLYQRHHDQYFEITYKKVDTSYITKNKNNKSFKIDEPAKKR